MGRLLGVGLLLLHTGCLLGGPYSCAKNSQCAGTSAAQGECVQGWCAYEDDSCASEWRYSKNAGDGLAGTCLDSQDDTGSTTDEATPPPNVTISASGTEGESSTAAECPEGCTTPPGPCFAPEGSCQEGECAYPILEEGTPCESDDLCAATSLCDDAGACLLDEGVDCFDPPSTCYSAIGTCNPADGGCDYEFNGFATPCSDANACTEGDRCSSTGDCVPGDVCPITNECRTRTCEAGQCVTVPVIDGSPCAMDVMLCCGGDCLDVAMCP